MEIKMNGRYKTIDGHRVRRVLAIDHIGDYPVVVEFENGAIEMYLPNGAYYFTGSSRYDLVEVSPEDL